MLLLLLLGRGLGDEQRDERLLYEDVDTIDAASLTCLELLLGGGGSMLSLLPPEMLTSLVFRMFGLLGVELGVLDDMVSLLCR